MNKQRIPFILCLITVWLDVGLTYYGLTHGDNEGNPLAVWVIQRMGLGPALSLNIVFRGGLAYFLYMVGANKMLYTCAATIFLIAVIPWTLHLLGVW